MQRRQIAATVAAVTMSVVSGVIAFGANTGTLGFAAPQPATPTTVGAPPTAIPAPGRPTPPAGPAHESHDGGGGEHDG
jgi:hypothetical protein